MEELELDVGATVNVELMAGIPRLRADLSLIGFRRGQSLLVTLSDKGGFAAGVYPGLECVIRYLDGTRVVGFRSSILHVSAYPYRYMHLRYPDSVDRVTVRRAERVRTHLPATVHRGRAKETIATAVMDLSTGGALLLAHKEIGGVGDTLQLEFACNFSGVERRLRVGAVIRNQGRRIADDDDAGGYFGVEFYEVDADAQMFLNGYVYELIATRRKGRELS